MSEPRVGLVMGAGGVVGQAFHVATLSAIREVTGWDPNSAAIVVGTSAGSTVGAYLRAGISAQDLAAHVAGEEPSPVAAHRLELLHDVPLLEPDGPRSWSAPSPELWWNAARLRVQPGTLIASLVPQGRVSMLPYAEALGRVTGTDWPAKPFWICAARLRDGRRVVFGRDEQTDIVSAVNASCAIPGFFRPGLINGEQYVDGGMHSPTNADVLVDEPLDLAVVLSPMSVSAAVRRFTLDHPMRLVFRARLAREAARLRTAGIPIVTFSPNADDLEVMAGDAMDHDRAKQVVAHVRESVARRLKTGTHGDLLARLAA